ncbi:hypothetical protein B0H65DRAFT_337802 [Neurospora tetraspora]|uniref:Uncharacterized protein n=1 Tax=Neurospora tetraspora TaxID=94610 RepID=A0AAE0J0Y3_9PEZI|nr:hypothetical protein B0H65DRAFT_337802 [Neurospora tetraspora]
MLCARVHIALGRKGVFIYFPSCFSTGSLGLLLLLLLLRSYTCCCDSMYCFFWSFLFPGRLVNKSTLLVVWVFWLLWLLCFSCHISPHY